MPFEVQSQNGLTVIGIVETALETPPLAPAVVLAPTFGKTMRNYFVLSWYLLRHGFRVVRYDNTCHIGVSEGDMRDYTLRSAIADLLAVTRYLTETVCPPSWGVVAPSLAFRVAIRAFCNLGDPSLLFALVGVVNLRSTLAQVIGTDCFKEYEEGTLHLRPSHNVLGHEIRSSFIETAAQDDLASLESTITDLRSCSFPIVHVIGENDPWISLEDIKRAYGETRHTQEHSLLYLPAVRHELSKNPVAASLALQQMVIACSQYIGQRLIQAEDVIHPNFLEIVRINKLELSFEKQGYRS